MTASLPVATGARSNTTAPSLAPVASPASARLRVQVLSVTDGDTIRVSIDGASVPVRYIGIDTPETVDPRTSVQCFGVEAAAANRRLVEGKFVELESDITNTDKYDRLLRYVWVELNGKSVMANEELVRDGFANASTYPPDVKYQDRLRALETEARNAGRGLWAAGACAAGPTVTPSATPVQATTPFIAATPSPTPTAAARTAAPTTRANCDSSYPTVCIPPPPPDLDCGDISYRRFVVRPPDPHRFDGDRDGIGCE